MPTIVWLGACRSIVRLTIDPAPDSIDCFLSEQVDQIQTGWIYEADQLLGGCAVSGDSKHGSWSITRQFGVGDGVDDVGFGKETGRRAANVIAVPLRGAW